jgi:hypothetical protein
MSDKFPLDSWNGLWVLDCMWNVHSSFEEHSFLPWSLELLRKQSLLFG